MSVLTAFVIGLLIGWIIEWAIDKVFWRSSEEEIQAAESCRAELTAVRTELETAQGRVAKLVETEAKVTELEAKLTAAEAEIAELQVALEEASTKLEVHQELHGEGEAAAAMEAAEAAPVEPDDLKVIEGIGPKIEGILNADGILTYNQLAETAVAHLNELLAAAGSRYSLAVPDTWPAQARLAAAGDWAALESLQDSLTGGRETQGDTA